MASTAERTLHVHHGHGSTDDSADANGGNGGRSLRLASVLGAGALAYYAFRRRDTAGVGMALLGGALLERAIGPAHGEAALAKQRGAAAVLDASKAVKVERTVTIMQPADALYRYWRNFENLPRIMAHLESVVVLDSERSRWKAKAPAGASVEWDAVIHHEVEGELIAWRSEPGADVKNAGSVHFTPAPGDRGTEVKVVLEYEPPAGKLGVAVATLLGEEPDIQVREDLRRFKQMMEAGEVPTIGGQPRCD